MNYLKCPICDSPKYYRQETSYQGLRYHLESFHKRCDVMELIELAEKELQDNDLDRRLHNFDKSKPKSNLQQFISSIDKQLDRLL